MGVTVLLKGNATVVADPDGVAYVNPTGTPWLATAGSGDVLSGLGGALLAGGVEPALAAALAAYLHGLAGSIAAGGGDHQRDRRAGRAARRAAHGPGRGRLAVRRAQRTSRSRSRTRRCAPGEDHRLGQQRADPQADDLGLAAPVDQRDQAGRDAGVDGPGQHAPEPLDPAVGEGAHGQRT